MLKASKRSTSFGYDTFVRAAGLDSFGETIFMLASSAANRSDLGCNGELVLNAAYMASTGVVDGQNHAGFVAPCSPKRSWLSVAAERTLPRTSTGGLANAIVMANMGSNTPHGGASVLHIRASLRRGSFDFVESVRRGLAKTGGAHNNKPIAMGGVVRIEPKIGSNGVNYHIMVNLVHVVFFSNFYLIFWITLEA